MEKVWHKIGATNKNIYTNRRLTNSMNDVRDTSEKWKLAAEKKASKQAQFDGSFSRLLKTKMNTNRVEPLLFGAFVY